MHHLRNVLRLAPGDEVEAVSRNETFRCRIEALDETKATLTVLEGKSAPALVSKTHLIAGEPKGPVADLVVEKCVELGVSSILFFTAERSQGRDFSKRSERLHRIAQSAAKQSGAPVIDIERFPSLAAALESLAERPAKTKLVLASPGENRQNLRNLFEILSSPDESPDSSSNLQNSTGSADSYLIIGPEGGLTAGEYEIAARSGFEAASLGAFTLRVETAAVVACGCLLLSHAALPR